MLLQKKYEYANLVRTLEDSYKTLVSCYNKLLSCKKMIVKGLTIDEVIYNKKELDSATNLIWENMKEIEDRLLPRAKKEYNDVLIEIANLQ